MPADVEASQKHDESHGLVLRLVGDAAMGSRVSGPAASPLSASRVETLRDDLRRRPSTPRRQIRRPSTAMTSPASRSAPTSCPRTTDRCSHRQASAGAGRPAVGGRPRADTPVGPAA
jgi:hypothetical protein